MKESNQSSAKINWSRFLTYLLLGLVAGVVISWVRTTPLMPTMLVTTSATLIFRLVASRSKLSER